MIGGTNCGAGGEPAPKSNVIVTTTESELVGKSVTFEQGAKTLTKEFTDSKQVVFTTKEMGIVSITCEEISKSVNVATLGVDYNVSLNRTRVVITTESDDLVGQTVTLKKNDETIESKAFTSAKSLTFIVSTIGIYTAYCGDYEVDVNVTALGSTYSGEIVPITEVTVTVNGGALETITIMDSDGTSQTVTTNSSGTTIATLNTSKTYTFSGGVSGYSVQKTIASDTSKVDVMPSGVLYWYGYKGATFSNYSQIDGWTYVNPTWNTNNVYISGGTTTSGTQLSGIKCNVGNFDKLNIKYNITTDISTTRMQSFGLLQFYGTSKSTTQLFDISSETFPKGLYEKTIDRYDDSVSSIALSAIRATYSQILALWLE